MRIGFIGLGVMGCGMARNLAGAGHDLLAYDVDEGRREALARAGVGVTDSPAGVAEAGLIFLSLPDTGVVQRVLTGEGGLLPLLAPETAVVDLSTISYTATVELHKTLAGAGVQFLDAPVSGMEARANDGTLTVMCGGSRAVFDRVEPCLRCIGNTILHMGGPGAGQLTKLVNQLLFDINAAAIGEILPMAASLGLDPEKVGQVVNSGTGRSYASAFFIPRILEGNFGDGYLMERAYKDLVSAAELGAGEIIPMPVLAAATTTYQLALRMGYGGLAKSGMIRVYENILDVKYRKENWMENGEKEA